MHLNKKKIKYFFYILPRISKPVKKPATQLEKDHERLLKQEKSLRKDMGKQRIKQLKMANEDEDKAIHKLEKLLKINKSKSKKKGIPNMFKDGLDYALEMCLPENIEKMYAAAKEAADAEQQSDSEWQEDFAAATGEIDLQSNQKEDKKPVKTKAEQEKSAKQKAVAQKKAHRLREIETKYFGASDDELASDLSDVDSEFGKNENYSELGNSDLDDFENGSDEDGEDEEDDYGDDDKDVNGENDESDDDAPEEMHTVTKSSHKRKLEKLNAKKDHRSFEEEESEDELDDDDSFDEDSDDEPKQKIRKSKNSGGSDGDDDDEDGDGDGEGDDIDGSDDDFDSEQSDGENPKEEKPEIWEDIYGRKRDKEGNVINEHLNGDASNDTGKYIPPHLRARMAAEAANGMEEGDMDPKRKEKLMRLKRLLKGQLNRLSEANMHKISSEIDNLYMQNSRYDMNTTLAILISDSLISRSLAPERMVMEHALLVAALHANVGTEVGANMLENLVDRFHKMIEHGIVGYDVEDKTLDNIIFVLCHMYTFKVRKLTGNIFLQFIFIF